MGKGGDQNADEERRQGKKKPGTNVDTDDGGKG